MAEDLPIGLLGEPIDKKSRGSRRFKYYGERKSLDVLPIIRLLQDDVCAALKTLPDESIHCCVTSPPYYGLRDYQVEGQIGLEQTPDEYVISLVEVFSEVRRVLRDDGTFWLNIGNSYAGSNINEKSRPGSGRADGIVDKRAQRNRNGVGTVVNCKPKDLIGIPWMLAFALRADGWYLRSEIIWNKVNSMPESVTDRPTSSHEQIFLFSKSEKYYYDNESVKERADTGERIVDRNATTFGQGITMPDGNPRFSAGARVTTAGGYRNLRNVDPFSGSGTTAIVAAQLQCNAIGIELNPKYVEMSRKRIAADVALLGKATIEVG